MKLNTTRIQLRAPEPTDLDFLYILENEDSKEETGFATAPLSRFQLEQYIRTYNGDIFETRQLRFVIEEINTKERIGCVDICDYQPRDRRGFVSINIAPAFRRQGYGTEALTLVCNYASETLGMHQLASQVAYDNEASHALFHKCGFKTCGSLRSWLRRGPHYVDALLYQLLFPN